MSLCYDSVDLNKIYERGANMTSISFGISIHVNIVFRVYALKALWRRTVFEAPSYDHLIDANTWQKVDMHCNFHKKKSIFVFFCVYFVCNGRLNQMFTNMLSPSRKRERTVLCAENCVLSDAEIVIFKIDLWLHR